jgi:hypothetical protein
LPKLIALLLLFEVQELLTFNLKGGWKGYFTLTYTHSNGMKNFERL